MTFSAEPRAYGVVVLTMGKRPSELAAGIESLQAQRGVDLDIIVVGNGWQPEGLPDGVRAIVWAGIFGDSGLSGCNKLALSKMWGTTLRLAHESFADAPCSYCGLITPLNIALANLEQGRIVSDDELKAELAASSAKFRDDCVASTTTTSGGGASGAGGSN